VRNPYISRGPIKDPKDFFGRKEEVNKIFSFIDGKQPQSCSIIGERKIGKTSLLLHIKNREVYSDYLRDPYIFVYYNFEEASEKSREAFFREIIDKILKQVQDSVQIDIEENANFEGFKELLSELKNLSYRLILLLDEIELAIENPDLTKEFYEYLRSLIVPYDMAYITASRKTLHELQKSGEKWSSPFFNIFGLCRVGLLKKDEAVSLILKPAMSNGMVFDESGDVSFILDKVGYNPFFIQVACFNLFEVRKKLKKIKGEPLDKEEYDEISMSIAGDLEDHFEYNWDHLEKEEKKFVLKYAHENGRILNGGRTSKSLIKKGIVVEENGSLKFSSSLFKNFVKEKPIVIGRKRKERNKNIQNQIGYFKSFFSKFSILIKRIQEHPIYGLLAMIAVICSILALLL
jgi:hypothetical protein